MGSSGELRDIEPARRRICVIRQNPFPSDPRVRKQVAALLDAGHYVDIICLGKPGDARREVWNGANVFRVPLRHRRTHVGWYMFQYAAFLLIALLRVTRLDGRKRYDAIQVNTLPDALVFSAFIPWLRGARVVLDFQELMPEMFAAEFPERRNITGLLRRVERLAAGFADHVIIANPEQATVLRARAGIRECTVIPNVPEDTSFAPKSPRRAQNGSHPATLITHGTLVERYGAHVLLNALPSVLEHHDARVKIIGEGEQLPELIRLAQNLGVHDHVTFSGRWVKTDELAQHLRESDVGVVPILAQGYMETVTPNKVFDYIASGLPVVASATAGLRAYLSESDVRFFEPGNAVALSEAIRALLDDRAAARALAANALRTYQGLRWERVKRDYEVIYRDAIRRPRRVSA